MNISTLLDIPKAYATILFLQSPVAGIIILAVTMLYPNIGLAGLLAAITGFVITRLLQFPDYSSHIQIYNSLLVGLSLGAFYQLNYYMIGIIILGAVSVSIISTVLADWFWRLDRLPVLALPFVIVAGVMAIVAKNYTELNDYMGLAEASYTLIQPTIDTFFSALGVIFFTPTPIAGLILFITLTLYSRYLGLLAIIGYVTGYNILTTFMFEPHPGFIVWTSFNFILIAIAIGGIFTIPGIASLIFAIIGVLLTALLVIATKNLLLVESLPVMAVSFTITTLAMIIAMKKRLGISKPYLAPEPGLPEVNYEKARLAKYRFGNINSVPLLSPVFGTWTIYQGFNGKHTHKAPWQYALDFFIVLNEQSYDNQGEHLEDFYCFGAPVLSPVHGDIVRIYDRLPDNAPGEVDTKNNWGNFIIIKLASGLFLMLAHLQQASIKVKEGDRVSPGKNLAACGNSGRSPQPHLHMQIQHNAELDSPTHPFHLCSVIQHREEGAPEYKIVMIPKEGDSIESVTIDDQLRNQFHLPVGRQLNYRLSSNFSDSIESRKLTVELSLLGQFRLSSETQASSAFEENNGVLAFYDRKGSEDILLDMWVLANGLTPLTEMAHHWRDSPSAKLLPLSIFQKFRLALLRPLGCGISSQYTRKWDNEKSVWIQQGSHQLKINTTTYIAHTNSIIDPVTGIKDITLDFNGKSWHAELIDVGLISDQGIPQWHNTTEVNSENEYTNK